MSGYGGQPPPGWQDPYGGQGHGSYGQDPYGRPPPGYGPPGVPHASVGNGGAIAALICNILAVVMCCNVLAIAGIVTSAIALGKAPGDPRSLRTLTIWSWAILAGAMILEIALIILAVAAGWTTDSNTPDYTSTGV